MTEDEMLDLTTSVRRCLKSKKVHYFWITPKGADGEPHMLLGRKRGPTQKLAKAARKVARMKVAAHGEVHVSTEGLVFVNDGKLPGSKLVKVFKTKLAPMPALRKVAAAFRGAQVYTREEFEAASEELELQPPEGADSIEGQFEERYAEARAMVDLIRSALGGGSEHAGNIAKLANRLDSAAEIADSGDIDVALGLVGDVIENAPLLLRAAWAALRARVSASLGAFLKVAKGTPQAVLVPELRGAWDEAHAHREKEAWEEALDGLEVLEARLDELHDPEEEVEYSEDELAEAVSGIVMDGSELSLRQVAVKAMEARLQLRSALDRARSGIASFDAFVRSRPELMADSTVVEGLEGLEASLIPDFSEFEDAIDRAVVGAGSARLEAFEDMQRIAGVLNEAILSNEALTVLEQSSAGNYPVQSALRSGIDLAL